MSLRPKVSGEWIRWGLLVALVIATQFLDSRYVPKGVYAADQAKTEASFGELKTAVATMGTAIALLQRTEKTQADHELRLRALEARRSTAATVNSKGENYFYDDTTFDGVYRGPFPVPGNSELSALFAR